MFDKFGDFDSFEELNTAAEGLKNEGDLESLTELAKENGLDPEDAQEYADGVVSQLCTAATAALAKLSLEKKDFTISEIVGDWIGYIESELLEDETLARGVRKKGKTLIDCIGRILKWSYTNMYKVDNRIIKASGISATGVKMGIPGMATAKEIIRRYYCE